MLREGSAYRILFWYMSKDDAINIMNDSNLVDKRGFIKMFLLHIKMNKITDLTYYQKTEKWY